MSVIEAGGRTIDISLRVAHSKGQIIFIEEKKNCYSKDTDDQEIARLMRYVHSGKPDKYIVNINKGQIHTLELQGLKIRRYGI